jgi:SulP family sulfate permease
MPYYIQELFKRDLIAALTLFVMLVPQGMAYAMLAGLPPVMGLYASTIPLLVYAFFASSKHLSVGPVAISSLLVFSAVSVYAEPGTNDYISTVLILAFLVGAIQLLLGLLKAGIIVKFIPHSVLNGYTSAAAIVIGISQLKHLLGIEVGNYLQVHFLMIDVLKNIDQIDLLTVIIGGSSIAGLFLLKKVHPRFPGALVVLGLSTVLVLLFQLDQSGVKIVGEIPSGFPSFVLPPLSMELIKMLFPMALTISLIAFMESLAIAKAVARKEKYKINANKELKALGLANLVGSCFHSFPVNGSFSRTAVNHQAGGSTQVTSIITGVLVIITIFFFTSFFYYVPHAVLAAIIIAAVYKLIDIKELKYLFQVKPFEGWIWLATFFITLFVGIQWGIIMGVLFTLVILLKQSAEPNIVEIGYVEEDKTFRDITRFPEANTSEEVLMIRIDSTLHFANITYLEDKVKEFLRKKPKAEWIILDMSGVNEIDAVSVDTLEELIDSYQKERAITVLFMNMKGSIRDTVGKAGWDKKYKEHFDHQEIEKFLKQKKIIPLIKLDYFI